MYYNNYNKVLKKINEPIAFVAGRYLTTGLGVVRILGRRDIPVVWLNSNPKKLGFLSRYCIGLLCPHPKDEEKKYIDFLMEVGATLNCKGVLLPIGDIEVTAILKHKKTLEKYFHIPTADFGITETLLDKEKFYRALEKQKIPCAKTFFPTGESELESISKKLSYPVILKPIHSDSFKLMFNVKNFIAGLEKELIEGYNKAFAKNHKVIVQEIIPGDATLMHGLNAYYDKKGNPHGVFMYRRIREWPHDFGNGCLIERVEIPELKELIDPFIKKIGYHGIIDAEFKKDPRDNAFKLVEINPRIWMQVSLPARYGMNLPLIAYNDALGKKIEKIQTVNENIKWLYFIEDAQSVVKSILKRNFSFRSYIESFKCKKEYAIFSKDDPLPLFVFLADIIYRQNF